MEGNGMSRAAKKRAMKRQKQQHSKTKQNDNATVEEEISTPLSDEATESKDVILKRRLPMEDAEHQGDNHVKPMKKKSTTEKKMKKKRKASVGDSDDEQETADASKSVSNQIERDVDKILAQLTPRQLLFPSDEVTELDQNEMAEGGLPDPKTLARDITAEKKARCVFNSILSSANITADEFYNEYWEKKPIVISLDNETDKDVQERHRCRFDGFLSMKEIRKLLKTHALRYGQDLNVTRYEEQNDGVKRRITLDLLPPNIGSVEGGDTVEYVVADAKDVWSNFQSGCTVRLLCPQKHVDPVHSLLSTLELEFGCMIGANAYLTPGRNSQGFAPHYDDIEAFILQLEGYKHWRVYPPFNKLETLPRVSSRDYTDKEMEDVEPVLDVVLGPGDVLYMPRGWIHQAHTPSTSVANEKDGHSLHLTISAMQTWAWGDLLDMVMPEALEAAAASDTTTSLREGLPRNFLSYMGAVHDITSTDDILPNPLDQTNNTTHEDSESEDEEEALKNEKIRKLRESFKAEAKKRIMRVCKEAITMLDAGCDQIAKRFLSDRLPPALTKGEMAQTSDGRADNGGKVWPNTMCRLVRPGIARLVLEDEKAVLYHCADNSRSFHGNPLSPMEFELDDAPALELLLTTVEPHWICVEDLLHGDIEDKMEIAQTLYDEGILSILQSEKPDRSVQVN